MAELKDFIRNFNFNEPDWLHLPDGFPNCDLFSLNSDEIGKFRAIVTVWKLSRPEKPKARSRVWQDPKGYQYLGVWPACQRFERSDWRAGKTRLC